MCAVSFALGRWRALYRRAPVVRLAAHIDLDSYCAGFEFGQAQLRQRRR